MNHLGHFALTGRLLPLLLDTAGSRVVVVSSTAAHRGKIQFEDLDFQKSGYKAWPAYSQSKLANQLFTRELQKRLAQAGAATIVSAAHPGWTATDLQRTSRVASFLNRFFAMEPPQGALPTLRAATDPTVKNGQYFGPSGFMQMNGYPKVVPFVEQAMDDDGATRLWEVSEKLTGVSYSFAP